MVIAEKIKGYIKEALQSFEVVINEVQLEHPTDIHNGDFSSNIAFILAKELHIKPLEAAQKIVGKLSESKYPKLEKIEVGGNGFINFFLTKDFFSNSVKDILLNPDEWGMNNKVSGKVVMVEYTQPNPFKPFHIGHLMSNTIGESISRIFQFSGADVIRANYQGDIGPHVAKAIWAILEDKVNKKEEYSEARANKLSLNDIADYIGNAYVRGSSVYETDPASVSEIDSINKKIYEHSDEDIDDIYQWGRKVTLEAFEKIYEILGTKFNTDCYFFESQVAPIGLEIVQEFLSKGIFEKSDGAIIFRGEKYDPSLHTRVFINKFGLPTYETKELGLTKEKFKLKNPDISIVDTAIEQKEYMKVVFKAIELINKSWADRTKHITHGMMRFAGGKMSSRKGNVITGESLITDAKAVVYEKIKDRNFSEHESEVISVQVGVGALKYSILKQALGSDIIYDFEKSISFEGDSGPYLQYTTVRAQAILEKAKGEIINAGPMLPDDWKITPLEKYLYRFPDVIEQSYQTLEPHYITTYLIELASLFNSFYSGNKIIDSNDPSSPYKLAITQAFYTTMKNGLYILGISVPDRM